MRRVLLLLFFLQPLLVCTQPDTIFYSARFGSFIDASSISISRGEFVFVTDLGANKIYKFDSEGKLIASFGGTGLGKNELNQPVSLDASNGLDVFVCDYLNNRIVRLDSKLNLIATFDFNNYNSGIEISKKVYNPASVTSMSTGELLVLCEAGNFKAIRIRDFSDVNLYFGRTSEKILDPLKIVKGNTLDAWVLEKSTNELLNFNNLGIFVDRIKLPETFRPISVAYADQFLVILFDGKLMYYDLVKGAFSDIHYFHKFSELKDIVLADKETLFILLKNEVLKFVIK